MASRFKWTLKGRGRPRSKEDIRETIVRLAKENLTSGYTPILGGLNNLGMKASGGTVANVLSENGIVPASERGSRTPRKTFLKAHWEVFAPDEILTTEVRTKGGLVMYYAFFVIELKPRRGEIGEIPPHPDG